MVKFWAKRIGMDLNRINEVPKAWREQVREYIESQQWCVEKRPSLRGPLFFGD